MRRTRHRRRFAGDERLRRINEFVADVYQERVDTCLEQLGKINGAKVKVEPKNVFLGLDAYQKLIESGVDVVILATPPGFRPAHLRACIEA